MSRSASASSGDWPRRVTRLPRTWTSASKAFSMRARCSSFGPSSATMLMLLRYVDDVLWLVATVRGLSHGRPVGRASWVGAGGPLHATGRDRGGPRTLRALRPWGARCRVGRLVDMTTADGGAPVVSSAAQVAGPTRDRVAGWWGLTFVVLLLLSAGMASVPGGSDPASAVRDFYTAHTGVIVVAQVGEPSRVCSVRAVRPHGATRSGGPGRSSGCRGRGCSPGARLRAHRSCRCCG